MFLSARTPFRDLASKTTGMKPHPVPGLIKSDNPKSIAFS
jgi:hypothetical protein